MLKVLHSLSGEEPAKQIAICGLGVLRGFASKINIKIADLESGIEPIPGLADSGDLQSDLPDLFEVIGRAAQAAGKGWVLLVDEVQCLSKEDLSVLIAATHRMSQIRLPVLLVGAGLPQMARLAAEARSYSERLFVFHRVGALEPSSAIQAIEKPLITANASIAPAALSVIVDRTRGYPFFLQAWASIAWNNAEGPEITLYDVNNSYAQTLASLDASFFKAGFDLLTKADLELMKLLSDLGDGPFAIADISKVMGGRLSLLGASGSNIISKGIIYSLDFDYLDFTAPFFADFVRRQE